MADISNLNIAAKAEQSNIGCKQTIIDTYAGKMTKQELKEINLLPQPLQGFEKAKLALAEGVKVGAVQKISEDLSDAYKNRDKLIPQAFQSFMNWLNQKPVDESYEAYKHRNDLPGTTKISSTGLNDEQAWSKQHRHDNPVLKFAQFNPITQLVDSCAQALIPQEALTKTLSGSFRSYHDIKQVITNPSDDNFYKARATTAANIGPGVGDLLEQTTANTAIAIVTDGVLKGAGALRRMAKVNPAALEPLAFTRSQGSGLQTLQIPVNNQTKAAVEKLYSNDQKRWHQLYESGQTLGTGWEPTKFELKNCQGQAYYELTSTQRYLNHFEDAMVNQPKLKSAFQKSQSILSEKLKLQQSELQAKLANNTPATAEQIHTANKTALASTGNKEVAIAGAESKGNVIYAPGAGKNVALDSTNTKAPALAHGEAKGNLVYAPGASQEAALDHTVTAQTVKSGTNVESQIAENKLERQSQHASEKTATEKHVHTSSLSDASEHSIKLWRTTVNGEPMILMPVDKQSKALVETLFQCDQKHLDALGSKQIHLIEENGHHFYALSGSAQYLDYFEDRILRLHPDMKLAQFELDIHRETMQTLLSHETPIIAPPADSPFKLWRCKAADGLQKMMIPVNKDTANLVSEIYAKAPGLQNTKLDLIQSDRQEFYEFTSSKADGISFEKALADNPVLAPKLNDSQLAVEAKLALYKQEVLAKVAQDKLESTKPALVAHQR